MKKKLSQGKSNIDGNTFISYDKILNALNKNKLNNSTNNTKSNFFSVNNISLSIIKQVNSFEINHILEDKIDNHHIDKVVSIDIIHSDNNDSLKSSIGENFEKLLKEKLKLEANFIETTLSFKTSFINNSMNPHHNTSEDASNHIEELIYFKHHLIPFKKERVNDFQIIIESDENTTTKYDEPNKNKDLRNCNSYENNQEVKEVKLSNLKSNKLEINIANNFTISNNVSTTAHDIIDTLLNSNNNTNGNNNVNNNLLKINVFENKDSNIKDMDIQNNVLTQVNKDVDPIFKSEEEEQIFKVFLSRELLKLLRNNYNFITGVSSDYNFQNIDEILLFIITCPNGSKFMQKYLNNSSKLVNGIMFESVSNLLYFRLKTH